MSALAVVPTAKPVVSLYDCEEGLSAMCECIETVAPDQEGEFLEQFSKMLTSAREKRDAVGAFLGHLDSQIDFAKQEIKRLQERKASMESALDKLKSYVVRVIESVGLDAKGKPAKLEGNVTTFSLRKCPASVEILDEPAVPLAYKAVTIEMAADTWEALLDMMDVEEGAFLVKQIKASYSVDKRAIKAALDGGTLVPGADWTAPRMSLVRK